MAAGQFIYPDGITPVLSGNSSLNIPGSLSYGQACTHFTRRVIELG
jgi:hypothetical protein